jgi:hypothetical protein
MTITPPILSLTKIMAAQCHHPDGVLYSSGSNNVTTKLLVPAGVSVHCNGGDTFFPVHPKTFAI